MVDLPLQGNSRGTNRHNHYKRVAPSLLSGTNYKMANPPIEIPPHKLHSTAGDTTTSITIGDWTISSTSLPISNSKEIDDMQETLKGLPIPEMPFGNNSIVLHHEPSGWDYKFGTTEALAEVKLGELGSGDGGVKVGYANAWMQSRRVIDREAREAC